MMVDWSRSHALESDSLSLIVGPRWLSCRTTLNLHRPICKLSIIILYLIGCIHKRGLGLRKCQS